jgi:CheY-like chemotaxis protein
MAGHDVRYASSGVEAIAAAIIGDIDVILMDVRMPEIDGFEATRRIRALGTARGKVPILGLTAQAFSDQVAACLQAGMDGHLAKPYTPDGLQEAVRRVAAGCNEKSDTEDVPLCVRCESRRKTEVLF